MPFSRNLRYAALAFLLWSLAYNVLASLLPLYARELGAGPLQIGLVGTAGLVGAGLLVFPLSLLADRAGRRSALLTGWALSSAGLFAMALAGSWQQLLPGAFLAMAAVAGLPTLNALALDELAPAQRARGFSLLYASAPLGALVGALLGGVLAESAGLRTTAWLGGLCAVLATISLLPIRASPPRPSNAAAPGTNSDAGQQPRPLLLLLFGLLGAGGFLFVALPGSFIVPYLRDVAHLGYLSTGLSSALLAAAQLAWSLLFALWPLSHRRLALGRGPAALRLPTATLVAIAVCLAANGLFGVLLPLATGPILFLILILRGSQFSLQSLGSSLLGEMVAPGPRLTTRLTLISSLLGAGAAAAPLAGGWLYGYGAAYPFLISGVASALGAAVLLLICRWVPADTAQASAT
jgi:MFS family permease